MQMPWRPYEVLQKSIPLPAGYRFAQLRSIEVPALIRALRGWYPAIQTSSEACHLDPDFFTDKTYLGDRPETASRLIFPLLLWDGDRLVFYYALQVEPNSRTITGRFLVIDPEYRGKGLGHLAPAVVEAMGKAMGAELVYYYVSLNTLHQQALAEGAGYELVGIIPASDRYLFPEGQVKRVYEGIYAKVLVEKEECFIPPRQALTPNTQKLWDFLFEKR